mmetsp:Transcript_24368/g.77792  ORF Transcript_24368/g.77792 Transcript_24368/m.77792 type:complete len:298 (-) Transcript_24368:208-1101(-)
MVQRARAVALHQPVDDGLPNRPHAIHVEDTPHRMGFWSRWTCGNLYKLVGTGGSWFLFDVIFYGNIIFTPFVVELVFAKPNASEVAALSAVIALVALPGLYLASLLSDRWGRKRIQIIGFACTGALSAALFILLKYEAHETSRTAVFLLYCLTFFFYNFGPNATTFCLPAETFDKDVRSFFNGISAALGKAGALVGAAFFKLILDTYSLATVMLCSAGVSLLAVILTLVFVRDMRAEFNRSERSIGAEATRFDPPHTELELRGFASRLSEHRPASDRGEPPSADSESNSEPQAMVFV